MQLPEWRTLEDRNPTMCLLLTLTLTTTGMKFSPKVAEETFHHNNVSQSIITMKAYFNCNHVHVYHTRISKNLVNVNIILNTYDHIYMNSI